MPAAITNIFVLMLENRSFDHMLGFSGIHGIDAASGQPTAIRGLAGTESNRYGGQTYPVTRPADESMPIDPGHEFPDVLAELCGGNAAYAPGGAYPTIDNSGFVSDYASSHSPSEGNAPDNFGEIMKCFAPEQLPVLTALARNFAVCDGWHASIPGPTWPNRLFACGASSGGLDHSPTTGEILTWESIDGFAFPNGSIFDALKQKSGTPWRIFAGDEFPLVAALKGVSVFDIANYSAFAAAVASPTYPWPLTWIEPSYGDMASGSFKGGNSQHPLDGVTPGEALIKSTYEAIRNSPHWNTSLLVVTWDEHGGFYDHVAPPAAVPPGDTTPGAKYNRYGFTFAQHGVRVPAVVASPLIPAGIIDHRLYDHSSIPATITAAFGLPPLTARDKAANNLLPLLSLTSPRTDAPTALPAPATPAAAPLVAQQVPAPESTVDSGNLPAFLHVAMRHDLALSPPEQRHAILTRVQTIQTRAQAAQYLDEVRAKVRAATPAR
ncbi:MAG TPA: alkaline phosphatase family protein [Stellaceae bacterium]|jgi:phospholipase C|nr:alkaline phosphatase family protein [Stellaceae bacterium]